MDGKQTINKFTIISIFLIIAILISAAAAYTYIYLEDEKNGIDKDEQNNDQNTTQKNLYNISAAEADELIKTNYYLTIVDCRGLEGCSSCQFNKGHLPGAELNMNPSSLFNTTNDILVYSKDGTVGYYNFSIALIGKTDGTIYNLKGGYSAWVAAGFEIEKN